MTGNGKHTTSKTGDDRGMVYYSFTRIHGNSLGIHLKIVVGLETPCTILEIYIYIYIYVLIHGIS